MVSKFRKFTGGAEAHIAALSADLERRGHIVSSFSSEDLPASARAFSADAADLPARVRSAAQLLWNREAGRLLTGKIRLWRPDIVHYHSIYHQLSPSVLMVPSAIATVMTLHDYKLAAPCYSLFRDGNVCVLCVGRSVSLPAVRYRCVKESALASAVCVGEEVVHRRRYVESVDKFIVPSAFAAKIMIQAGVPETKLSVISWGVDELPSTATGLDVLDESYGLNFLYAGRLHASKGIDLLLDAWRDKPGLGAARLHIAGDGELREKVVAAERNDSSIRYLGLLDRQSMANLLREMNVVVVPSLVPETFGLSAIEALRAGVPVLASDRGALAELHGHGVLPMPDLSTLGVAQALSNLIESPELVRRARRDLSDRDMSSYTTARMTQEILDVYAAARNVSSIS